MIQQQPQQSLNVQHLCLLGVNVLDDPAAAATELKCTPSLSSGMPMLLPWLVASDEHEGHVRTWKGFHYRREP
jgi:hypothetical protein